MNNIKLTTALYGFAALAAGTASCKTSKPKETAERPNILFILSDDHTSQAWGVYGGIFQDYVKNENIRRLASEGTVLENCFCTNSISVPSRASILTGKYSHQNGVRSLADALSPDSMTIVKSLRAGGYQTALFGKWHLKQEPAGFDHYAVFHDQGEYRDPYFKTAGNWVDDDKGNNGVRAKGFSTDLVTDSTMNWIRNRDKNKPFLMLCHFKATHEPWDFPERLAHIYDDVKLPEPATLMDFDKTESGRTFDGQTLETIGRNWEYDSANPGKWWCEYPGLPFTTQGLDPVAARRHIYNKYIKDYLRCGVLVSYRMNQVSKY